MKLVNYLCLLGIILTIHLPTKAQTPDEIFTKIYPVEALQKDFATLRYHIDSIHAGLYAYSDKVTLEKSYEKVETSLNQPMTHIEFFRKLTPLLSVIKNGHTEIYPSKTFLNASAKEVPRFPFDLYLDRDTLFVWRNMSGEENIPSRSALLTINGESTREILDDFKKNITRDGDNPTLPDTEANSAFKTYYGWHKGFPKTYEIEYLSPNGSIKIETIRGIPLDSISRVRKRRYGPLPRSFWASKVPALGLQIEGDVAVMTLKTFGKSYVRKTGQKKFYKESFEKIVSTGVNHLILDLRNNGGGDPEPTIELFSHLYDQPFTFYKRLTTATKKIPEKKLYSDNIGLIHLLTALKLRKKEGYYEVKGVAGLKESKPAKNIFKGKVYTLTNARSFSATGEMTAILKDANRCLFIGEEPGGNPNQNASGVMLTLNLPNTGVRAILPLVLFEMNVAFKNNARGVIPDHIIKPTIDDVLAERDPVMEFTKQLIEQEKMVKKNGER